MNLEGGEGEEISQEEFMDLFIRVGRNEVMRKGIVEMSEKGDRQREREERRGEES